MPRPTTPPSALTLASVARRLGEAEPRSILAWAIERYRKRITLACSFGGPTGMVALDMAMQIDRSIPVYYLETGLLFDETHALIEKVRERYGIDPIPVTPWLSVEEQNEINGRELWKRNPDLCCKLRKVEAQRSFLRGFGAWISGVRRDQSAIRRSIPVVAWDETFGLAKISPFARWDERMVWAYARSRKLPLNELHERGYPSIGCTPCTRAIRPGENLRAGRWPGHAKTDGGLHVAPPTDCYGVLTEFAGDEICSHDHVDTRIPESSADTQPINVP
jgi:phosphoadenosine phosphosulfate reductase